MWALSVYLPCHCAIPKMYINCITWKCDIHKISSKKLNFLLQALSEKPCNFPAYSYYLLELMFSNDRPQKNQKSPLSKKVAL